MNLQKKLKIIILFLCISHAQENNYRFDFYKNPENTYWWIEKNNFGKYPKENLIDFSFNYFGDNSQYILNLSNALSKKNQIRFGESYFKHNFKNSFFKAGRYYRDFSLYLNDELSSGSVLISHNAQPLTKIGFVGTLNFSKKENLSFKYGISHGQFEKNKFYSDAPFLHEKFIYLNFSRDNLMKLSLGFVHEAIWAGTTTELGSANNAGNQPDSFKDFLKVFISADGRKLPGEPHANALGSHIGIWDFLIEISDLKLYYQHYFEDTSSLRFANKTDGLWGVELNNFFYNTNLLIEYLDTSNCCIDPPYQDDDYYYNYQYKDGWKYRNMTIGNPFINELESREKIHLIHLGAKYDSKKNSIKLLLSRKINFEDKIRFGLFYDLKFSNLSFSIFTSGYGSKMSSGFGVSFFESF